MRIALAGEDFDDETEICNYPIDGIINSGGAVLARLTKRGYKWTFDALAEGFDANKVLAIPCFEVM